MRKRKYNIALVAGGTAGHVFPMVTLSQILFPRHNVWCFTDRRGLQYCDKQQAVKSTDFAPKHEKEKTQNHDEQQKLESKKCNQIGNKNQIKTITLPILYTSGKSILRKLIFLLSLIFSFFISLCYLWRNQIDLVVSFGGYASFPTTLAAIVLRRKLVIHEQNSVLGRVNRMFLSYADLIATSFLNTIYLPEKYRSKVFNSGMIIRPDFKLSKKLKRNNGLYRIFIIGGSQGATIFSSVIPEAIQNLDRKLRQKIYITQQARIEFVEQTAKEYSTMDLGGYQVAPFFDDAIIHIAEADLVIARAGASTIAELAYNKVPAILVPLPNSSDNHQYYNAVEVAKQHGAIVLCQNKIMAPTTGIAAKLIPDWCGDISPQFDADNLSAILSKLFVEGKISVMRNSAKQKAAANFLCDLGASLALRINRLLI